MWRRPIPAKANRVKSVAATTLLQSHIISRLFNFRITKNYKNKTNLICLTVAPFLSWPRNHLKTPLSWANFHITPWPPGLETGSKGLLTIQFPSSAATAGTRGYNSQTKSQNAATNDEINLACIIRYASSKAKPVQKVWSLIFLVQTSWAFHKDK